MAGHVLDTSALLTLIEEEPGALRVLEILGSGVGGEVHEPPARYGDEDPEEAVAPVLLPFMALMEIEYIAERRWGSREAERLSEMIQSWPVELIEPGPLWRRRAAEVKAHHRLSVADAWICSLALLTSSRLVHKDPEFDAVRGLRVVRLE